MSKIEWRTYEFKFQDSDTQRIWLSEPFRPNRIWTTSIRGEWYIERVQAGNLVLAGEKDARDFGTSRYICTLVDSPTLNPANMIEIVVRKLVVDAKPLSVFISGPELV